MEVHPIPIAELRPDPSATLLTVEPEEVRLREVLSLWTPEERGALLNVLTADDDTRVAKIGELHQAGGSVAELLIDLEEDPVSRVTVIGMLRVMGGFA